MNKKHWNSVYFNSDVPFELMNNLVSKSYQLVVEKLPKKEQHLLNELFNK